uniref:MFS domain-containing protein n=1 Tax=Rhabditophanes sp. KR3021 TaxID=114890 RepID=A0AC35TI92_9BILA
MNTKKFIEPYKTPWVGICYCIGIQFICGLQGSIFYVSMWSYLTSITSQITVGYYGWCIAAFSLAQTVASPLFGWWSEKCYSIRIPTACGLLLMCVGNLVYCMLAGMDIKYFFFFAILNRVISGGGEGCLSVIRAYIATACYKEDRSKAVTIGFGSYVLGLAMGPSVQLIFIPLGTNSINVFNILLNVFNAPAFLFAVICMGAIFGLYCLDFPYNPHVLETIEAKKKGQVSVNPQTQLDYFAIGVLIYIYVTQQSFASNDEVLAAPLTISLYNWTTEEAIKYNGIIFTVAALCSVSIYLIIAYEPFGKFDKRKVILVGLVLFAVHHIVNLPWGFYDGPLDFVKLKPNSTTEDLTYAGGCSRNYSWCKSTSRVPLYIYISTMILSFGFGYPCISSSVGTMYANILGNRKQDIFQGILEGSGSFFRCIFPPLLTLLFDATGYKYTMLIQFTLLFISIVLVLFCWRRLISEKYDQFPSIYSPSRKLSANSSTVPT